MSPGTAAGKVLLATAANPPILPGAPRSWTREAALIRDRGVAFDREELAEGVCCAAVPLRTSDGAVIASLFAMLRPTPRLASVAEGLRRVGYAIIANLEREPTTVAS
jgi:IclR family transcriptional regulator, acetate operon repressor